MDTVFLDTIKYIKAQKVRTRLKLTKRCLTASDFLKKII